MQNQSSDNIVIPYRLILRYKSLLIEYRDGFNIATTGEFFEIEDIVNDCMFNLTRPWGLYPAYAQEITIHREKFLKLRLALLNSLNNVAGYEPLCSEILEALKQLFSY